jgi:hypothetical protein
MQFVERLIEEGQREVSPENRSEPRYRVALKVAAQPVDERLQPVGEGFYAVTRDISSRGIALFHSAAIQTPYLALEFQDPVTGQQLQAVLEVLRCRPLGPFHEIAGQFVTKLYDQPAPAAEGESPRPNGQRSHTG